MIPCRGQFVPLTEPPSDQVQKHHETALDPPNRSVVEPQMAYAMSFINNIERCLSSVEMSVKMDVLGSIFSGKMVFENGKCRTAEFNPIIAILMCDMNPES